MKLDPLAEMHLLLREHGWEPDAPEPWFGRPSQFFWQHTDYQKNYWHQEADCQNHTAFLTDRDGWRVAEVTGAKEIGYCAGYEGKANPSIAALRRRLKQLAKASPAAPRPSRQSRPPADRSLPTRPL
jgi:hypothetical protein